MINTIKWFDREFDFKRVTEDHNALLRRLGETVPALQDILTDVHDDLLNTRIDQKWSVKEHVGHLTILEPLWQTRITDILQGKKVLTPADLDNKATWDAGFNKYTANELINAFGQVRAATLQQLALIDPEKVTTRSLHPRIRQELSLRDHLYFVAEHDMHHVECIRSLLKHLH